MARKQFIKPWQQLFELRQLLTTPLDSNAKFVVGGVGNPNEELKGKHILFLADLFPPEFAPRVLSVVEFFHRNGACCTVCTEQITKHRTLTHGKVFSANNESYPVYRIPLRKKYNRSESIRQVLWNEKDKKFALAIEKQIDVGQFDLIFAFTFTIFPLVAAKLLAKKYRKPWVADCRDITEQYNTTHFLPSLPEQQPFAMRIALRGVRKYLIGSRTKVLHKATAITTVSPWHQAQLQQLTPKVPCFCFYNGYDEELFYPRSTASSVFKVTYTGRLLSLGMRNPSLFLEALSSPRLSSILTGGKFEVHWYIDAYSQTLVEGILKKLPPIVSQVQRFHAMVPFRQVPQVLSEASVILLLNNKEDKNGPHGIVSTKIFEAFAMRKPILSTPGDGAITDTLLKLSQQGVVGASIDEICSFVAECYNQWEKFGSTNTAVSCESSFTERFKRSTIAHKFAQLALCIIDKQQ